MAPRRDGPSPGVPDEAKVPGRRSTPGRHRAGGRRRARSLVAELPVLVVLALGLALLVKTFVVQAFYIPSGSMEPTLQVGDRVLVDKLSYRFGEIERGDVIVFDGLDSFATTTSTSSTASSGGSSLGRAAAAFGLAPGGGRDFIKRVVGLPGDRVTCCDPQGRLLVNNAPLDEAYIHPGDTPSDLAFDVEVPPGRLWVMGDHRSRSADSRAHLGDPGGGTVPVERVVGRAFVVVWPLPHAHPVPAPALP